MQATDSLEVFHIHITLPDIFTQQFAALIPLQRQRVNKLLEDHVILNYCLDMGRNNVWMTMQAKNQKEAMDILSTFPIIKYVKVDIHELAFYDSAPTGLPELIMN
ncbi:MAG: hypothetical protein JST26_18950 [Bacteroidetes bacterium]|nr:hypothetical protein [Bacteroidota bacterium]